MAYPNHKPSSGPYFDDRLICGERLSEREESLFGTTDLDIEVIVCHDSNEDQSSRLETLHVKDDDALGDLLQRLEGESQHTYFIIRQTGSWGRFKISGDMFKRLLEWMDAFPPLLDFVLAFGFKLEPHDEYFGGLRWRMQSCEQASAMLSHGRPSTEAVYNVRYFERHGRNLKDPWSLRQTAIYQRFDCRTGCSRWIIIQPSNTSYRQLREIVQTSHSSDSLSLDAAIHAAFLLRSELNWRQYINYLEGEFYSLEEKALLSRVGKHCRVDFHVAFADIQQMQTICNKFYKCRGLLDTSLDVAAAHEWLLSKVIPASTRKDRYGVLSESLDVYKAQLRNHRRGIDTLLDCSAAISKILFQILEYRNDETLIETSNAQRMTSESTRIIAEAAKEENKTAARVLTATHGDTQVMKALTYVAIIYLPASLIATIFNSNLIIVDDGGGDGDFNGTGMRIVKGFWMFPVFTLALLLLTLFVSLLFVKRH